MKELRALAKGVGYPVEIVVVDDGSSDGTATVLQSEIAADGTPLRVLRNERNRGYGFSLKRGIQEASHPVVVITDADGTYPNAEIPKLVEKVRSGASMVVGARSLGSASVPWTRKPAKWLLNFLANFLAGRRIPDLNSGLRAMRRDLVAAFEPILPDGFSFTTTITLAAITNGFRVEYVPIDYAKRQGTSKIRPIRDTANFFNLVVRTVLYFRPLKVFTPLAVVLLAVGLRAVWHDINTNVFRPSNQEPIGDVSIVLLLAAVYMLVVGFLADLASYSMRSAELRKTQMTRSKIYENPLGYLLVATAIVLAFAVLSHLRDKYSLWRDGPPRPLTPKTLALYVTTLQFFSAALLADLLQRRGRLR